ncbi:MAG: hypothetical protein H7A46_10085 [Verrucomicrobiales bacterium]|nr:hypothetical protein [Verrucomicrobiales bacterium]
MKQAGFTIVFGGPNFLPDDFLRSSTLEPSIVRQGDTLADGSLARESWLEFSDIHEGTYPLDVAMEALDFLQSHCQELIRLARFPGVVTRTLSFFGDADSCMMELDPTGIGLLHELSLHVSVCPCEGRNSEPVAQPNDEERDWSHVPSRSSLARSSPRSATLTPLGQKRLIFVLSLVTAILAVLAAWGWGRFVMAEIDAALADGWTDMLQEGRDAALAETNVTEVADTLRWVGRFYRPPEPPASGIERHHYHLMERVRASLQQDLVAHLRQLTGDQLGDDPKLWVQKYAKPE